MRPTIRFAPAGLFIFALAALPSPAQSPDAALRDRVAQLVERLDAPKQEARDSAEKALITLGAKALPFLPDSIKPGTERGDRVERVRVALREAVDRTNTGASRITIKGQGIRLTEAVRMLQSQSGNTITDLREQMGADATNPALDLDLVDVPFFAALDQVAEKGGVMPSFFAGDGSIGLMVGGAVMNPAYIRREGPFRVALKQVGGLRDFQTGAATANVQFEIAWEPRLRPMLLALKVDEIEVIDDQGRKVMPDVMDSATDTPLQPGTPAAEVNLNLAAPDRTAKSLAKLKVKAEVTVPDALRTFKFANLAAPGQTAKQGDIAVTHSSFEVDEQLWKVGVEVAYPGDGPAFESYRQGLFNNRIWLQKADGSRFDLNGGFSNTGNDAGKIGFEYVFVDAPDTPKDYQLVYVTPSKVIQVPLEFTFENVPLP